MPWVELPGVDGVVFVPEQDTGAPKKHNCADCFSCNWCSDARCAECLGTKGKEGKPCCRKKGCRKRAT